MESGSTAGDQLQTGDRCRSRECGEDHPPGPERRYPGLRKSFVRRSDIAALLDSCTFQKDQVPVEGRWPKEGIAVGDLSSEIPVLGVATEATALVGGQAFEFNRAGPARGPALLVV